MKLKLIVTAIIGLILFSGNGLFIEYCVNRDTLPYTLMMAAFFAFAILNVSYFIYIIKQLEIYLTTQEKQTHD